MFTSEIASIVDCDNFDTIFSLGQVEALPVTSKQIALATSRDPTLSKVTRFVQSEWPNDVDRELKPYFNRRYEITMEKGCLMWEMRVIIPPKYHTSVLDEIHLDHPGIQQMKTIVCSSYTWWPRIDFDITNLAKSCICQ